MGFAIKASPVSTLYDGSSLSGSDGTINRTLTHTKAMLNNSLLFVGGRVMFVTEDYTVSGAVITFLGFMDDTDKIVVYD